MSKPRHKARARLTGRKVGAVVLTCALAFIGVGATATSASAGYWTPSGYVFDLYVQPRISAAVVKEGNFPSVTLAQVGDAPKDASGLTTLPILSRGTLYGPFDAAGAAGNQATSDLPVAGHATAMVANDTAQDVVNTATSDTAITQPGYYSWVWTSVYADQSPEVQAQLPAGWVSSDIIRDTTGWAWMSLDPRPWSLRTFFVAPDYTYSAPATVTSGDQVTFTTRIKGVVDVGTIQVVQTAYLQQSDANGKLVGPANCSVDQVQTTPAPSNYSVFVTAAGAGATTDVTVAGDHTFERGLYQWQSVTYQKVPGNLYGVPDTYVQIAASTCDDPAARTFVDSPVTNTVIPAANVAQGIDTAGSTPLTSVINFGDRTIAYYTGRNDLLTPTPTGLPLGLSIVNGAVTGVAPFSAFGPQQVTGAITSKSGLVLGTYSWSIDPTPVSAASTMVEGAPFTENLNTKLSSPFPRGSVFRKMTGAAPAGLTLADDGTLSGVVADGVTGSFALSGDVTSATGTSIGTFDWALTVTPAAVVPAVVPPVVEPPLVVPPVVVPPVATPVVTPAAAPPTDNGDGGGAGSASKILAPTGVDSAGLIWLSGLLGAVGLLAVFGSRFTRRRQE